MSKKSQGATVWISTKHVNRIYYKGGLAQDSESLAEMFRNAGGSNATRNLASVCILLPMINNGIGISPEYRSVINRLNLLAGKHPEWFHEDLWIQAFQQIIEGLTAHADDDLNMGASRQNALVEPAKHETKPVNPVVAQAQVATDAPQAAVALSDNKDSLKNAFDKF